MIVETFVVGPMDNSVYVIADETAGEAAVVDPGIDSERVLDQVRQRGWKVVAIINTHAHFDHVFGDDYFKAETGAPLLLHAEDAPLLRAVPHQAAWLGFAAPAAPQPDRLLREGDRVTVGSLEFTVLHTPGHTPGGISLVGQGVVFSGDTLFAGSIGRTDLPGGDHATELRSIREKLLVLPDDTLVYPGHGPTTTIGREKAQNPYLAGA